MVGAERVNAQLMIGSQDSPQSFSQLEIVSGNCTGLRLPQISTTAQRDAMFTNSAGFKTNPLSMGLQIFNLETGCVEVWSGKKWIAVCAEVSVSAANNNPVLDINTEIDTPIVTHTTEGATGIGTPSGLPAGIVVSWENEVISISGTPTEVGTFEYSIPLLGGTGTETATGTIVVNSLATATNANNNPILDINTEIVTPIVTHSTEGATGIGVPSGLPAGIIVSWKNDVISISGTPTEDGSFEYSIPLIGGKGTEMATGTIVVRPLMTVGAASDTPEICISTALSTAVTHATTGATGIGTATGLPTGVTAAWENDVISISGTPSVAGTFNYEIPLTGGCGSASATGTITVIAAPAQPSVITGPYFICVQPSVNFSVTNVSDMTYKWTLPQGWDITSGDGTNAITVTFDTGADWGEHTISVVANDGNCDSQARTWNVKRAEPRTPVAGDCMLCSSATLSGWLEFYPYNLGANSTYSTPAAQAGFATPTATTTTNMDVYGGLYQWGRIDDGHGKRYNGSTNTIEYNAAGITYNANGQPTGTALGKFITGATNWDHNPLHTTTEERNTLWANGANNPCPAGYHLPTRDEWHSIFRGTYTTSLSVESEDMSGVDNNRNMWKWHPQSNGTAGYLITPNDGAKTSTTATATVFLPAAGGRSTAGMLLDSGVQGNYWSSHISSSGCYMWRIDNGSSYMYGTSGLDGAGRAIGYSLRCVADY